MRSAVDAHRWCTRRMARIGYIRSMIATQIRLTCLVVVVLLAACSTGSTTTTQGRDDVIIQWGKAKLSADFEAMAELLEPAARDQWTSSSSFQQLLDIPQPEVELKNLSFDIESETGNTVNVVYTGERCAQTVANDFVTTTVASSDEASSSTGGSVAFGEIQCVDLRDSDVAPDRFMLIDDVWYATLGQLG